jgi:hypothetical protein
MRGEIHSLVDEMEKDGGRGVSSVSERLEEAAFEPGGRVVANSLRKDLTVITEWNGGVKTVQALRWKFFHQDAKARLRDEHVDGLSHRCRNLRNSGK